MPSVRSDRPGSSGHSVSSVPSARSARSGSPVHSVPSARSVRSAPSADRFALLNGEILERWSDFCAWETEYFPNHVGMKVEELRVDYARLRLPWQPFLGQPEGAMHGGVIAALIDTCAVPAVATAYEVRPQMATVQMDVQFLAAVRESAVTAECWVTRRGRALVFCSAEVCSVSPPALVATASLIFRVSTD